MKKNWWKECKDQNEIQRNLREMIDLLFTNEKKRVFQVFDCNVFSKDFLMELFSSEGNLKNAFEVLTLQELSYNSWWGDLTYSNKTKELWKTIDLYIKYCNPTIEFEEALLKKLKIVQIVDGYIMINGIKNKKGVGLGLRKRLGFYRRTLN